MMMTTSTSTMTMNLVAGWVHKTAQMVIRPIIVSLHRRDSF